MSESDLFPTLSTPNELSRLDARDVAQQISAAVASSVLRDTLGAEAHMENLGRTVATERCVSEAQRDAARAVAVFELSLASSHPAQRQQVVQHASRAKL